MSNGISFKKRDFNKIVCCYTIDIAMTNFKPFSIIGDRPCVSLKKIPKNGSQRLLSAKRNHVVKKTVPM